VHDGFRAAEPGRFCDEEVIAADNEHNLAMVFTGTRCFKH